MASKSRVDLGGLALWNLGDKGALFVGPEPLLFDVELVDMFIVPKENIVSLLPTRILGSIGANRRQRWREEGNRRRFGERKSLCHICHGSLEHREERRCVDVKQIRGF
jgi:hypothetical protein